ncbi:acyltransferase family protein [Pseudonocardia nematodicida]|uniref:Acyltransferase family protein n=1 Tax=Pseudonocardia nematodicida TaxID=1206997 RepID=A0ABV1K7L1_9PSEU
MSQTVPGGSRTARHAARPSHPVVPYSPGLDGVRAIAVLAVLAYHLDLGWAAGGFLGVEVFFTLSGFLITQLLVAELYRRGRVDVATFVRARARRLLPALVVAVVGILVAFRVVAPESGPDLREHAVFSLLYLQNWHLLLAGVPYGEPSPLLHLWSLSVEAQLYLVWPVVFVGLLAFLRPRTAAVVTLAAGVLSAVVLAARFDPDGGGLAYYATDGRASGFLVGAALALVWRPEAWSHRRSPLARNAVDAYGAAALVVLLGELVVASEFDAGLYGSGGFLRTGLLTAVVIAAATRTGGPIAGLLGNRVLTAVGTRSYGLYLYHWPVFVLFRDVGWAPLPRDLAALGVTVLVTELSYRCLELPVRRGGIRSLAARLGYGRPEMVVVSAAGIAVVAAVVVAGTAPAVAGAAPAPPAPVASPPPSASSSPSPSSPSASPGPGTSSSLPSRTGDPVLVVGDSIVLGNADALLAVLPPGSSVDGKVGRQFAAAPSVVGSWAAVEPGPVVVVLGANGTVEPSDVDAVLEVTGSRHVVFVGVEVPRRWSEPNDELLRATAARSDRVAYVDWPGIVGSEPGLLGPDGVHPGPRGAELLVEAISGSLDRR